MKNMYCYNCRIKLKKEIQNKEHIPAQAFYGGYGSEFKVNRITVPACRKCNEDYSKTDQELRDAIGVTNDIDKKKEEYTRKSAVSILRKKGKNKLHLDTFGNVVAVRFNYSDLRKSAIKDFKGIFYHKFNYPLPKEWRVEVVANFENEINLVIAAKEIYAYVYKDIDWSISGHEDIFRYKIKTLVPDIYGNLNDTGNLEDAITIASIQEYHKKISFVVLAVKHKYLNSKRKQQKKQLINKKKNKNKKDLFKQIQRNKALKKLRIKRKKRN